MGEGEAGGASPGAGGDHGRARRHANASAAWASLLPTLAGSATERFTNATGFSGQSAYYALVAAVSWRIDFVALQTVRQDEAVAGIAQIRATRAEQQARDQIHQAWHTVRANLEKSRSSRAQEEVSIHAARIARDRFRAGTATQLDLAIAERDAFASTVARIQQDAELAYARAALPDALVMAARVTPGVAWAESL